MSIIDKVRKGISEVIESLIKLVYWLFLIAIAIPTGLQLYTWLKKGYLPEADIKGVVYSMHSPEGCGYGQTVSVLGKNDCRPDYIQFTEWVGLNNIFNWFSDLHIIFSYGIITLSITITLAIVGVLVSPKNT